MMADAVGTDGIEDLTKRATVKKILELGGAILRVGRTVGRLPRLVIKLLPLVLETVTPSGAGPELGLFKIDGLGSGIERGSNAR
jgi:hypothetical protein